MKTKMKCLLIFAFFIGAVGLVHAGRQNQGWTTTTTTGTSLVIGGDGSRTYFKRITLSSATASVSGEFVVVLSTVPSAAINGAADTLLGGLLFQTTAQLLPALVYSTTATVTSGNLNNGWTAGDCDTCYIEIEGSKALVLRQPTASSGEALKASVMWSK